MIHKYLLPFFGLLLIHLIFSLIHKLLKFAYTTIFPVFFFLSLWFHIQEVIVRSNLIFSKSFTVVVLTFRSLIQFKLIFAYGVWQSSNFILSHVIPSSICTICWKDHFSPSNGFGTHVKNNLITFTRVLFSTVYSTPFVCTSAFMTFIGFWNK